MACTRGIMITTFCLAQERTLGSLRHEQEQNTEIHTGKTDFAKFGHRLRIGPIGVYFKMVMNKGFITAENLSD
jgi:hypothetical protein